MSQESLPEKLSQLDVKSDAKPQKQAKEKKPKKKPEANANDRPLELTPAPEYIAHRLALFDKIKSRQQAEIESICLIFTLCFIFCRNG